MKEMTMIIITEIIKTKKIFRKITKVKLITNMMHVKRTLKKRWKVNKTKAKNTLINIIAMNKMQEMTIITNMMCETPQKPEHKYFMKMI